MSACAGSRGRDRRDRWAGIASGPGHVRWLVAIWLLPIGLSGGAAQAFDPGSLFGNGGGVGQIVYDPTNHLEAAVSASQAVRQTALQVRAEIQRIQQLETELQQLKALPDNVIRASLQDWDAQLGSLVEAARTLGSLGTELAATQQMYSGRLREIALLGLSPQSYLAHEIRAAAVRGQAQGALFAADHASLQAIERARGQLAQLQRQIPASSGVHQSLQTSNQYLDLLVGQTTQLLQLSAAQASVAASGRAASESSAAQADARESQRLGADLARIATLRQSLRVQEAQQGWGVLHPLP